MKIRKIITIALMLGVAMFCGCTYHSDTKLPADAKIGSTLLLADGWVPPTEVTIVNITPDRTRFYAHHAPTHDDRHEWSTWSSVHDYAEIHLLDHPTP